jgi:hypothetical protein
MMSGITRMPNEVTSGDSGWRVLFAFLAQWPAAAEFLRSATMRGAFAIIAALALAGCGGDVLTKRFETLDDAKAQRAFERGWLPPVMPESARGIVETNNLDLNIGTGVCSYDIIRERTVYLERLMHSGASLRTEQATDVLTLTTNGSRWEIRLPRSAGWLYWKTTLQK